MNKKLRWGVASVAVVGALATAAVNVGASGSASDSADPIEHVLGTDDATAKQAILDAQSSRQNRFLNGVGTCLEAKGFSGARDAIINAPRPPAPPVMTETEEKATYGYSVTTNATTGKAAVDPIASYAASLPSQRQQDLQTAAASCTDQTSTTVYGRLQKASDAFDSAKDKMFAQLAADPAVRAAATAWKACMGGEWDNPPAVADYLRTKADKLDAGDAAGRKALHQEEMALAQKDTQCQQEFVEPVYGPKLHDTKTAFVKKNADLLFELRSAMLGG